MPPWIANALEGYGLWILFGIVFLNNMGLPVPGDTFLLAAGVLAQDGVLPFQGVVGAAGAACFLGGTVGYLVGRHWGRKVLRRLPLRWITPERMKQAERFLDRYGGPAVFFARFVALVHPVTGLFAGVGRMRPVPFLFFNLLGSAAYALLYVSLGYFFGESWDWLKGWIGRAGALTLAGLLILLGLAYLIRRRFPALFSLFPKAK